MKETCSNVSHVFAQCRHIVLMLLLMVPLGIMAQNVNVYGKVTDTKDGEAVIGATVKVKGASSGSITDMDGNYKLSVRPGATLEISYVGYKTKEVRVNGAGKLDVQISEDSQMMDEVVVVGYGVMKRSDLTGSVSSINEEAIKQGVNTSIEQAMQGRIAGVQVTQNSGAPGGGISVQIRGINSLNGNEPLYVIDGIAMSGQTSDNSSVMASINPSDITSLEVLKDASATAIYGSRASNGVVLITTKRGQEGKAKLTYEGYMGWQSMPKRLEAMNLPEFAKFYNVRAEIYGYGKREELLDQSLLTNGTNWQDELFKTAFMHNHQLNVNGGNKDMHYSFSGGYLDQDGVGVGSSFRRVSFRGNFDTKITDWLQIGINTAYSNTKQVITFDENNVIQTALVQYPDMSARNPDGSWDFGTNLEHNYNSNPLFEAEMKDNDRNGQQFDYNVYANVTPIKGLTLRLEYGGNRSWGQSFFFRPNYDTAQQHIESQLTRGNSRNKYESFKQYLTYDFDFNNIRQVSLIEPERLMTTGTINGISYVLPVGGNGNYSNIRAYVAKMFSSDPKQYEDPTILILNANDTPGAAANEKIKLEEDNYPTIYVDDVPATGEFENEYTLYARTEDKPGTKKLLEEKYNTTAKPLEELPAGIDTTCDFVIIVNKKSE